MFTCMNGIHRYISNIRGGGGGWGVLCKLKLRSFIPQTASNNELILGNTNNTIYPQTVTSTSEKVTMIYTSFAMLYFFHHPMHHKIYKPDTMQLHPFHLIRRIHKREHHQTLLLWDIWKLSCARTHATTQ